MDINRLRYFTVISKTESLQEASEILHISPPALSKAMKVLTEEVGYPLFITEGRGIRLTEQGIALAKRAEPLIDQIEDLKNIEQASRQIAIRIGTFEVFSTHFMGQAIEDHIGDYNLELYELTPGKIEDAIAANQIDIGITYIPIPTAGVRFLPVCDIKTNCYTSRSAFKNHDFKDLPFATPINPMDSSPNRMEGLDGWPDHEHPRIKKYQVTMMESALDLCSRGLAAGVFPDFVVKLYNEKKPKSHQLVCRPIPRKVKLPQQKAYLVLRKTTDEGEFTKKMAKAVRQICR